MSDLGMGLLVCAAGLPAVLAAVPEGAAWGAGPSIGLLFLVWGAWLLVGEARARLRRTGTRRS